MTARLNLEPNFAAPDDFYEALIEAHRAYLDRMVKKVLLLSSKAGREENLLNQVRELFTTILQFREATVRPPSHTRNAPLTLVTR